MTIKFFKQFKQRFIHMNKIEIRYEFAYKIISVQ